MHVLLPPRTTLPEQLGSSVISILAVTWQHPFTRKISPIGFLSIDMDGTYRFVYIRNVLDVPGFRPLLGFPDFDQEYASSELFPLFAQRVMDPRRHDFSRYVEALGISESPTPWEQIARSGGRRAGDTLQLLPVPTPVEGTPGRWEVTFLVHGIRHMFDRSVLLDGEPQSLTREELEGALASLSQGDELRLVPEPDNTSNPLAHVITTVSGRPIGYLPDLFTEDVNSLELRDVSCRVLVANDRKAPWHMRLVAKLKCSTPAGFQFFSTSSWEPLA